MNNNNNNNYNKNELGESCAPEVIRAIFKDTPIFIINLDKRVDRRAKMDDIALRLGVKFNYFPAYDITNIKLNAISSKMVRRGAIGCTMSHLGVLKLAKAMGYERVIIMEDDILLNDKEEFWLPKNWEQLDILLLGWGEREFKNLDSFIVNDFIGTHAYLANKSGYDKLIKICEKFEDHLDIEYSKYIKAGELNGKKMLPSLFSQNNLDSTIHADMKHFTDCHYWASSYAGPISYIDGRIPFTQDVAIVFPSAKLLVAEFGKTIDSHTSVIRFNKWIIEDKWLPYIGTKTTHIVTHNEQLINGNIVVNNANFYKDLKGTFLLYNDGIGEGWNNRFKYMHNSNNLKMFTSPVIDGVVKPTSGLSIIKAMIDIGIKPVLYGFDPGAQYGYYWDKDIAPTAHVNKSKESVIIEKWIKDGLVEIPFVLTESRLIVRKKRKNKE